MKKKIVLSIVVAAIVFGTTLIFEATQGFYKASVQADRADSAGDLLAALYHVKQAAGMRPGDMKTQTRLLSLYRRLGMQREAADTLKKLEERFPDDARIAEEAADLAYQLSDHRAAEEGYRRILRKGDAARVRQKLAEVLAWQKKYDEAIPLFVALLQERPDDAGIMELLADIYSWSGRYQQAVDLYRQIIARGAHSTSIMLKYAEALRLNGSDEEAVRVYNQYFKGSQ